MKCFFVVLTCPVPQRIDPRREVPRTGREQKGKQKVTSKKRGITARHLGWKEEKTVTSKKRGITARHLGWKKNSKTKTNSKNRLC